MGPATEISGGSAANTTVGARLVRGRVALHRPGRTTTSSASVFAHDIRAAGVQFDNPPRRRRPADRALPHHRDARRRAHDEHVPRRRGRARRRRRRRRPRRGGRGHVPRGLPLGPARREGGVSATRPASRTTAGRRVALTLSDPFCVERHRDDFLRARRATRSTCCSPTRPRSARSTRSTTSTTRSQRVRQHCEIAALTRSAKGSVIVRGDEAHVDRRASASRRSSTRPAPATSTRPASCTGSPTAYDLGRVRPARCARRGGGHLPPRRPARDVARPSWPPHAR